jgi:hypothetical protein
MKSYRFYGDEMEILGARLDAARETLATAKTVWARNYWAQNVKRLLFQWQQLPILHDGDATMTAVSRWAVDYDFYERSRPHEYTGITERAYEKLFRVNANLDASWEANRAQRLAKAQ